MSPATKPPLFSYPYLDFNALNLSMIEHSVSSHDKLDYMYRAMGGEFWCENIMKGARVGIVALGSHMVALSENPHRPLSILGVEHSLDEVKHSLYQAAGMSAFMSYLNPKQKTLLDIAQSTLSLEHYSILHTIHLSIFICGMSCGVEHEFSSQRDIIHLSRLTVAKTKSQNTPAIVLHRPEQLALYQKVLHSTQDIIHQYESDIKNTHPTQNIDLEARNLIFPSAKASAIMLTGSLKNFMKLVSLKDAMGREDEFIDILKQIQDALRVVFPEVIV